MFPRCAPSRLVGLLVRAAVWLVAFAIPARADVPSEMRGLPVVDVELVGVHERDLLEEVRRMVGEHLEREAVRDAIAELLSSDRWINIQVDALPSSGGVILRFALTPRIRLVRVEVRGNEELDDNAILQIMRVRNGSEFELAALPGLVELVETAYHDRGYHEARAEIELRDTDDPGAKVLWVQLREGEPTYIESIELVDRADEILTLPRHETAPSELGRSNGDILDRYRLDDGRRAMQRALREHGWLEAIVDEPRIERHERSARVRIPIRLGRHYRMVIEGYAPLTRDDVERVLHLTDEPLSASVLRAIHDRVVDLYRRHGFHHAAVELRTTRDPVRDHSTAGLFAIDIDAGEQIRVVGVSFPGASYYHSDFLRSQISSYLQDELPVPVLLQPVDPLVVDRLAGGQTPGHARSVPAPVDVVAERIWYAPTYGEALQHIEEVYQSQGFLSARVGPPELRELDNDRAVVTIPVFEGPQTLIYDVEIRGNEVLSTLDILEGSTLRREAPFGYLPLEEESRRIRSLYAERGYIFAQIQPTVHFSPDRERAEVVIDIAERVPVRVGSIRVVGALRTSPGVIRDVLAFRPGDLYRPSLARESEERLAQLGIFVSAQVAPEDPEVVERVKPVLVTVTERNPQAVGLSAGFATGEGARGSFDYSYRNLLGLAINVNFRVQLGYQLFFALFYQDPEFEAAISPLRVQDRLERRVTLGISVPWIPQLPRLRAALDFAHIRHNERDFGYDKDGVILSFDWRAMRGLTFGLAGEIEYNNVQLFGNLDYGQLLQEAIDNNNLRRQRLLRVPEGESAIGSARLSATVDVRDNPFSPSQGFYLAVTSEYVHSLQNVDRSDDNSFLSNFIRINAGLSGYIPLAQDWVIALQGRFGVVAHLESKSRTYPNRAFYLGGVDSMRGFLQDQMVPEDQAQLAKEVNTDARSIVRTGDLYYLWRAEFRFPILDPFMGALFLDAGNVWATTDQITFRTRWNAGLGIRLRTPVGPIALDYGFVLDRRDELGEPVGSLHFSIGVY